LNDRARRVPLARVEEVPSQGLVVTYRDGPFEEPAILIRTADGIRAWKNRCRHLALRLDCRDPGQLLDRNGNLTCQEHGATYRPDDGLCIAGPCSGSGLRPLPVAIEGGIVFLDAEGLSGFLAPLPDSA